MASKRGVNRRKRSHQCGDKHRHATAQEAGKHADRLKKGMRKRGDVAPLNVYRCVYCNHWHVGHKPRSLR